MKRLLSAGEAAKEIGCSPCQISQLLYWLGPSFRLQNGITRIGNRNAIPASALPELRRMLKARGIIKADGAVLGHAEGCAQ